MADSDAISIKVLVDAARGVSELKRTQEAAKQAAESFEKLSDAEKKAVVEMARLQAAARAASEEEKRVSAYVAEASKLRREETNALQQAARAAAEETRKFAAESARLAKEHERLSSAIEKTRDETAKLKEANDSNAAALIASRSKLGLLLTSVDQLGDKIKQVSPLWGTMAVTAVGSFARIAAGVGIAVAGISAATMALGRAAGEAENNDRAIRLLGGAYDRVRDATSDTVTAQQALTLQQGLVQSGLNVSGEQLAALTRRAREFALATGGETTEALGQMLDAMRGLEVEGLRRYGVTLQSTGDRQRDFDSVVRRLSSSQTDAEQTARKWGTALGQVNDTSRTLQQTLTGSQRTMTEEVERTSRSFSRMTGNIAAALASALDLNNVFQFWSDLFDRSANARNIAGDRTRIRGEAAHVERRNALAALGRMRERGVNTSTLEQYVSSESSSLDEVARIRVATNEAFSTAERVSSGPNADAGFRAAAYAHMRTAGIGALPGVQAMLAGQSREDTSREMALASDRKNKPRGSGADSGIREARTEYNRALAAAIVVGAPIVETSRAPGQTLEEYWRARSTAQQQANRLQEQAREEQRRAAAAIAAREEEDAYTVGEKNRAMLDAADEARERRAARTQRIDRRNRETRRMAREGSLGGRVSSSLGFATNDEGRIAGFDGIRAGAELLTGTVNTLTNGLTSLFDTLVSGSADAGTAFQSFASGLLTELGKMAVNKGLFYTFEGIAALFSAPPAAPLYFAAGAGLLALGAGLGIAGAATKPQVPSTAADTSTARSLAPRSNNSGSSMRDLAPVNVIMSSLVPAGPGDAQRLRNGLQDARRRGFGGDFAPRRLEH